MVVMMNLGERRGENEIKVKWFHYFNEMKSWKVAGILAKGSFNYLCSSGVETDESCAPMLLQIFCATIHSTSGKETTK